MPYKDPEERRAYQARYMREVWYPRNKKAHRAAAKRSRDSGKQERIAVVADYLSSHPCMDCGEPDLVVLEFDHRPDQGKAANISDLVHRGSIDALREELVKCDVVCANCHRRRTTDRDGRSWKLNLTAG